MKSVKRPKEPPTLVLRGFPSPSTRRRDPSPHSDLRVPRGRQGTGCSTCRQDCPSAPPPPTDPIRFLPCAALLLLFPPTPGPGPLWGLQVQRREREDPRPRPLRASAERSPLGDPRRATRSALRPGLPAPGTAQDLQPVPFQDGEFGETLAWPKEEGCYKWGFPPHTPMKR